MRWYTQCKDWDRRNEERDWQTKGTSHNDLIIRRSSRKSDGCTSDPIDYQIKHLRIILNQVNKLRMIVWK
jgi:hypothetical protein